MTKREFLQISICLGLMLLAFGARASAQQAAMATNPSGKPFFQSVALKNGQKQRMDFSVRAVGSVKGRVFSDAEAADENAEPQGIGGVKVSLRSQDKGFENFVIEKFTDESGAYNFEDLRPGKYSIEIDPANLPAKFRNPDVADSSVEVEPLQSSSINIPVVPQRSIMGHVFLDVDGDGQYKAGKDVPVAGAMITIGGSLAVSDSNGAYALRELPSGRIGLLVRWPKTSATTHVVLDLGMGPVTNRVVNVPMSR